MTEPDPKVELVAYGLTRLGWWTEDWETAPEPWRKGWLLMARDLLTLLERGGYHLVEGSVSEHTEYRVGGLLIYSEEEAHDLGDGSWEERTVTTSQTSWRQRHG